LRPVEAFYTDRSIARRFKGDLDGAAADVEAALKRNGKFPAAILNRGLVFLLQGKQDQAQGEFKRFADLRPNEKRYLEAEIEWARAGVSPNAAMVFLARTKGPTGGEADEAKSERPPAQQPPVAPREDEPASQPEQPAAEKQETGVIAFLKRLLPRYVTLICGIALLLVYTGTWLVLNDMKQMLAEEVPHQYRKPLQVAVYTIKFRRVLSLIAGAGLLIAYFLDKRMPMFGVLIIGAFFLSSLNKSGNARQLVTDAKTQK
jgi:tetratricopeptide (TPR) repeat protein